MKIRPQLSGPALPQIGQNTLPYQQIKQEGEAEIQEYR